MKLTLKQLNDKIDLLHSELIKAEKNGKEKLIKPLLRKIYQNVQLRNMKLQEGEQ